MTLSNWARFYVFSPLSRWLLMRPRKPSPTLIVLAAQLATMVVIGLWHGVTVNFVIWGLWHGLALFVHKQWSDRTRKWYRGLNNRPRLQAGVDGAHVVRDVSVRRHRLGLVCVARHSAGRADSSPAVWDGKVTR